MKNLIFADTCYWIALLNPQDSLHLEAMTLTSKLGKVQVITTDEVLVEVLNFFSGQGHVLRQRTVTTIHQLIAADSDKVIVLPQSRDTFLMGIQLYEHRLDKQYSLTDCISMKVMRAMNIECVLTRDHHFTQEGFMILFSAND